MIQSGLRPILPRLIFDF
jgi:primary-amine oxidase